MPRNSNNLFLALLTAAVILLGLIMTDNITNCANIKKTCPVPATQKPAQENFTAQGLPLHEAKYWKRNNE